MTDASLAGQPSTARVEMADGVRLHALVWEPAGATAAADILCVHGLASNALLWSGVAGLLAKAGHRVVAVDQRSHGRSDPSDALDWATLTDDLAAVCHALDLRRPVVAGQSWGGNVVVELARRRPEVVAGIVCVDGGTIELGVRYPDWETCWAVLAPPVIERHRWTEVAAAIAEQRAGWPADAVGAMLANVAVRADGSATPILTRARHHAILAQLWEHRPSALWGEVGAPVLILTSLDGGPQDAAKRAGRDAAVRAGRQVRSHDLLDAHHDVHAQEPERVVEAILDAFSDGFFAALPGTQVRA